MLKRDVLKHLLREDMRAGEKIAYDRKNNVLPDLSLLKTTLTSDWWIKRCPTCHDTFREHDLVRICPVCKQAYHDDASFGLRCWNKHFGASLVCSACHDFTWNGTLPAKERNMQITNRPFPLMEEQFFKGLVSTWKTFGDARIHIVKPSDYRIGHSCPMCSYKIRSGDRIVKCPCSDKCQVYFHNDVLRNWTCWNEWHGEQGRNYCPISSKEYNVKTKFIKLS